MPQVRIRPRLLWVGLAWLLFAVLVLTGVTASVAGSSAADPGADPGAGPDRFFGSGEVATLALDPAAQPVVYAALSGGGYVTCEAVGPRADELRLTVTTTDWSVPAGGREWHAAFHLAPAVAGTYQLRCDGPGATFGVGDQVAVPTSGGAAQALLVLVVLPLAGLVTAVTTTLVVLARRRAAHDRLLAPWVGGAAWPAHRW